MVWIQVGREGGRAFFLCASALVLPYTFLPECVGGRGCKPFSTLGGGACGMHTSGTGGRARVFFLCGSALEFSI